MYTTYQYNKIIFTWLDLAQCGHTDWWMRDIKLDWTLQLKYYKQTDTLICLTSNHVKFNTHVLITPKLLITITCNNKEVVSSPKQVPDNYHKNKVVYTWQYCNTHKYPLESLRVMYCTYWYQQIDNNDISLSTGKCTKTTPGMRAA